MAAELLFTMIDRNLNREVSDVVLDAVLVVRQSTAPPPPAAGLGGSP